MLRTFSNVSFLLDKNDCKTHAYIISVAGLPTSKAFDMSIGFLAVGFVGTIASWVLLQKVGRRRIYNFGLASLTLMMFIIAILDCVPNYSNRPGVIWAQSTIMVCPLFLTILYSTPIFALLTLLLGYLERYLRSYHRPRLLRHYL